MVRIVRTRQAREDVLDIWDYVTTIDVDAADTLIRRLDEVIRLLSSQPNVGSMQDKYHEGLRCLPAGNYQIFYDQVPDTIRILRILHGVRRWENLISGLPLSA